MSNAKDAAQMCVDALANGFRKGAMRDGRKDDTSAEELSELMIKHDSNRFTEEEVANCIPTAADHAAFGRKMEEMYDAETWRGMVKHADWLVLSRLLRALLFKYQKSAGDWREEWQQLNSITECLISHGILLNISVEQLAEFVERIYRYCRDVGRDVVQATHDICFGALQYQSIVSQHIKGSEDE